MTSFLLVNAIFFSTRFSCGDSHLFCKVSISYLQYQGLSRLRRKLKPAFILVQLIFNFLSHFNHGKIWPKMSFRALKSPLRVMFKILWCRYTFDFVAHIWLLLWYVPVGWWASHPYLLKKYARWAFDNEIQTETRKEVGGLDHTLWWTFPLMIECVSKVEIRSVLLKKNNFFYRPRRSKTQWPSIFSAKIQN